MTIRNLQPLLKKHPISASACGRLDMGGTLDLKTFYLFLRQDHPATFNLALQLRTRAELHPAPAGTIRVRSQGFESAVFESGQAPLTHPLGLMFAATTFFGVAGLEIRISSDLPPRSGLGGSSAATVALIGALNLALQHLGDPPLNTLQMATLAHTLEEAAAGHLCGWQDQLAAAYGGMHLWHWGAEPARNEPFDEPAARNEFPQTVQEDFARHILLAYTGQPHTSYDINRRWVDQFAAGQFRAHWQTIIQCVRDFVQAVHQQDYTAAAMQLNRETRLRLDMTPEVLNPVGRTLFEAAVEAGAGARFTGAGGGGCLWAMGDDQALSRVQKSWQTLLANTPEACLLPVKVDQEGLRAEG